MKKLLLIAVLLIAGCGESSEPQRVLGNKDSQPRIIPQRPEELSIPGSFFTTKVEVTTIGNSTYLSFICDSDSAIKAVSIFAKKHPEFAITRWRIDQQNLCLSHLAQHGHGVFVEHQP